MIPAQPRCGLRAEPAGLALACCLLVCSAGASAEQWRELPTNAPNVVYAIDFDSLERQGDVVRFREKLTYRVPVLTDSASGRLLKEKHMRRVMQCDRHTQGLLSGALYSDDGHMIEQVSFNAEQVVMSAIPAGSLAEFELNLVCSQPAKAMPSVKSPQP